ncbi:hypothetical protein [Bacillus manliponensis]|uniref:hypothetical protein n=1 Tax=Bacillus manliponensis TaxID=574376 RepID=UPI0035162C63
MKKWLFGSITILIETIIVYVLTKFLGWSFIDLTFFAGLCFVTISYVFSSKGGFSSNSLRLQAQSQTGIKIEAEQREFRVNPIFLGSFIYTVISLIVVVIYYWDYFA